MDNTDKPKAGRPQGSTQKSSQLKPVLGKLKRLSNKALENIQDSVDGKIIDKDVLASSKWVVNTLTVVHKAVISEEEGIGKNKDEETPAIPEDEGEVVPAFSLKQIK